MRIVRVCLAFTLTLLLGVPVARSDQPAAAAPGLYDRPVLAVDPGMHTAVINRASADRDGRWAVTGSPDKTVRVWSLGDGKLERTIRLPAGPGNIGKVYALAISPDGALIAAGGFTRTIDAENSEQIYLFDRASGALVRRIEGLPDDVIHVVFSQDGERLAAVLISGGLRVYARERGWGEVARDEQYRDQSYGADFAADGRLATAAYDGQVRLYPSDLQGRVRPAFVAKPPGGTRPYGIAFSPDGGRLAVGYDDTANVDVLDGRTLDPLARPDLDGVDAVDLSKVAWSRDGATLFASGKTHRVYAWSVAGTGPRHALPAALDTVMTVLALPGGDLLVAAQDPWLARLDPGGAPRWEQRPPKADFRGQANTLSVSSDGTRIEFGFEEFGKTRARFDASARAMLLDPPADGRVTAPRLDGLPIAQWQNNVRPTLDGKPLPLERYEMCRSLAVDPRAERFVLGADWNIRAFDAHGTLLWRQPVPGVAWAVNITGDGRLAVAAYGDGTIRWHRMSDGVELLAFMPLADRGDWVAWTPEGFYAATAGAHGVLRWHVNRGWDQPADSVPIEEIADSYRPAVLALVLQELETARALGRADLAEHYRKVMLRTNSGVPPGARLHLLTVGISAYNEDYAKNLRLHYADRDAHDLASAIVVTQASLYKVEPTMLLDKDASKPGILRALKAMRAGMQAGAGKDLAVIHFSGHGAMVDRKLYLLPYEVDARDDAGIQSNGLSATELRDELTALAKFGRVLVLLDACHSGATTMDGAPIAMDAAELRSGLAAANVTVLTSSKGSETSAEDDTLQHGAFTKALLDAFNDPEADIDRDGLISTTGLAKYLAKHVPALTGGAQTPGMEIRFEGTLFASGT